MANKIEGYVDGTGEGPEFTPYKEGNQYFPFWEAQGITLKPKFDYWRKAVVVVTDERVFTESEVKAMMDDIKAIAAEHSRKCYTNRIEQMTPPAPVAFHIDNYLWKSHGLSPDPA